MTHVLIRGAAFGLMAGSLAACSTTPAYPIAAASAPPPPPTAARAPMAQQSSDPVAAPPTATPRSAPEPVAAEPLAPVPSAPAQTPPQTTMSPPPAVTPEPVKPKAEPTRYTATGKVVDAKGMFRDYVVLKGDHLDAIARDLETTRATVVEANHLKNPDALKPGQHLKIPIEKAYVVQSGDTVVAVAQRFGVNPADLADLNALPERHKLRAGEELALPGVIHDHGPVAVAAVKAAGVYVGRAGYVATPWLRPSTSGEASGAGMTPAAPVGPSLTDGQIMAAGKGRFVWPVRGDILSSFGVKDMGRRNDGVDVRAPEGAIVHAAADGDVVYAGDQVPGFGNLVLVKHTDGWVTAYAHLGKVSVKMRDAVTQDQEIGQVGQTGGVSEPQLHFEVRYAPSPLEKAKPVDPLLVLPK